MKILSLVLGFLCFSQITCQNGSEIIKTFELLEEGSKKFEPNNENDVVLVLGATGSGKSTLIQWMAGDNTNLNAVETSLGSDKYLIEDTDDKIGSSSLSKTLYPELVVDAVTGTTFYDFPGFSDTRSPSYEIAASFFMKSVMDHIKNMKLLFLTSYYSVQEGMDRNGFRSLLKNIDELIADVDKFKNSIALVVTKVENNYSKQGRSFVLKPDTKVIQEIATFLQKIRKDFEEDLERSDISDKQRRFSMNAMKIIDIFLMEEDGELTRISLFRRPDEGGLLSNITLLMDEKVLVQQLVSQNLLFTQTDQNDFGFAISDTSKLEIGDLAIQINDQITAGINEIVTDIKEDLTSFVEPMRLKLNDGDLEALNLPEALAFTAQVDRSVSVLSDAVDYFTRLRETAGMGGMMSKLLSQLSVKVPESMERNFEKFSKYFEFFQLFTENPLPLSSLAWANSFQSALGYLTESKHLISDKASSLTEKINSEISSSVDSIVDGIKANFNEDINRMTEKVTLLKTNSSAVEVTRSEAKAFNEKLRVAEESMTKLAENVKEMSTPLMLPDEISETIASMELGVFDESLSNIEKKSREFNVLQKFSDTKLSFPSNQWSNSFLTIVTHLQTQNVLTDVKYSEEKIKLDVDSSLKSLFKNIQSIVDKKAFQIGFEEIDEEIKSFHSRFASISDSLGTETTLKQLITEIASSSSKLDVSEVSFRNDLKSLDKQENDLGFLKSLKGNENAVIVTPAWKAHVTAFKEYLDEVVNFNDFVVGLYEALSKFEVQKDAGRNWGQKVVNKMNFKLFVRDMKELNVKQTEQVSSITPSDSQLSILNDVLTATVKNRVAAECPSATGSTVTLKANFIKLSDFLDASGKLRVCGWDNVAALEIHALSALFIDNDLNAVGARLKLSITAPKLQVIGSRKINLDGKDGEAFSKAASGKNPGENGGDGLPGRAGGSAGSLFVVAITFIGSENLTISANGGVGGPGQSGGDGANGKYGETPPQKWTCPSSRYEYDGFEVECSSCNRRRIRGSSGAKGGNAGSCGMGGWGGFKGEVIVISSSKTLKLVRTAADGQMGQNGVPGKAGSGGRNGDDLIVNCKEIQATKYVESGVGAGGGAIAGALMGGPVGALIGAGLGGLGGWLFADYQQSGAPRSFEFVNSYYVESGRISAFDGASSYFCKSNIFENPLPAKTVQNGDFSLKTFKNFLVENSSKRFVGLAARRAYEQVNKNPDNIKILESLDRDQSHKF